MLPLYYHAHHSLYQEDIPFWLGLAVQTGDPVLELGCGTGRVLLRLTEAGYRAIGIDHSLPMLKFLQAQIEPGLRYVPRLILADITRFALAGALPLIILPCNTYSTLNPGEREACLGCVRRSLRQGGIFALSVPNPWILKSLPAHSDAEVEDEFAHPQTGNPVQVSSTWRRIKNTLEVTWIYDHLLPDGGVERLVAKTTHHMASLDTYIDEMQRAGLYISHVYGDFEHSEFTRDSPQLVILAIHP